MEFIAVIKQFGPIAGLIIFYIIRDYLREKRQDDRYETMEVYQKNVLTKLIESYAATITKHTDVMRELLYALRTRPCISEDVKRIKDGQQT